jgi:hypothetical protein
VTCQAHNSSTTIQTDPFGGDFVISMASDLAVKLLPPDEIDALSHVPFISDAVLGRRHRMLSVLGGERTRPGHE